MLKTLAAILSAALAVALAVPAAAPYARSVLVALGAIAMIGTAGSILPGRAGQFFAALGHDVQGVIDALRSAPPPDAGGRPKGPPSVVVSGVAVLLIVFGLGCSGSLPVVAKVIVDAGCVAMDFDALAAAEAKGAEPFIAQVAVTAIKCGIARDLVVQMYGTHKQSRAAIRSGAVKP